MCVMSWTKAYVTRQHSVNVTYAYLVNCCSSNNEIVFICRLAMRLTVLSLLWFTTKTAICIFIKKCSAPFRQGRWEVCSRLCFVSVNSWFLWKRMHHFADLICMHYDPAACLPSVARLISTHCVWSGTENLFLM